MVFNDSCPQWTVRGPVSVVYQWLKGGKLIMQWPHIHTKQVLSSNLVVNLFTICVWVWHSSYLCILCARCCCVLVSASCEDDVDRRNCVRWELTLIPWIMHRAQPLLLKYSINNKETDGVYLCTFILDLHSACICIHVHSLSLDLQSESLIKVAIFFI